MSDRTLEFLKVVEAINPSGNAVISKRNDPTSKSAFHDAAAEIARGVHKTSNTLSKLTKLVRQQGLFDDPTEQINGLIFRIKQDLDELNSKCDSAQKYVDNKKQSMGERNQFALHNTKVVDQLKTELMNATKDFKTVLEVRSSKIKTQQQRKVELTGFGGLSPMRQMANGVKNNDSLKHGGGYDHSDSSPLAASKVGGGFAPPSPYLQSDIGRNNNISLPSQMVQQQQQQLLLAPPPNMNVQYYESREQAVTEVEKTIQELGTLFKRLATMISEQQELVERIDDDVENAVENSNKAQAVLLKMYEGVSSNRGLYTKLSVILAVFLLFFVIFLM